ncbi:MAG: accessory factor UbiK family protein [Gammaproteobacteria bacterium]|nr:accessory factor UbiK family protein [Gammaproteobacteria bacterium]
MIFKTELLDRLIEQLTSALGQPNSASRDEIKSLLSASLNAGLARLNLVTREEFDAQSALLARTREKLDQLETTLALMEREQP